MFWWNIPQRSNVLYSQSSKFSKLLNSVSIYSNHQRTPVFCSQPLYGLLQAKLQLITHAYFEEKDFSQISILKVRVSPDRNALVHVKRPSLHLPSPPLALQELYDHMNSSLRGSALDGSQVYLGRRHFRFVYLNLTGTHHSLPTFLPVIRIKDLFDLTRTFRIVSGNLAKKTQIFIVVFLFCSVRPVTL